MANKTIFCPPITSVAAIRTAKMFTWLLYGSTAFLLILSFIFDRKKTKMACKKGWKSFTNILPQFLTLFLLVGMSLSILQKETIANLLGQQSGSLGIIIAGVVGSITFIPAFVAFPLAGSLLKSGAGYGAITMFLTTLMMVGVVTMPLEMEYFGKKLTIKRNLFALMFAIITSIIVGVIIY